MVTAEQAERLDRLAGMLATASLNLISARDRHRVRDVHIAEAVAVGALLRPTSGERWVDVGTGGGLPGVVLAVVCPESEWVLIDATRKKIAAVDDMVARLGMTNVVTFADRAERLARRPDLRAAFDGSVSRGLGGMPVVLELSRGFVRDRGKVTLVQGRRYARDLVTDRAVLAELSLQFMRSQRLRAAQRPSWLVSMRALGSAPEAVPRADGLPRSRPLGGHRA